MLKIARAANGKIVFTLSGRIEAEDVDELQRLLDLESAKRRLAFDLRDVTLVSRDAVIFLSNCEARRIVLENCPAYIQEWIHRERDLGVHRSLSPRRPARKRSHK